MEDSGVGWDDARAVRVWSAGESAQRNRRRAEAEGVLRWRADGPEGRAPELWDLRGKARTAAGQRLRRLPQRSAVLPECAAESVELAVR